MDASTAVQAPTVKLLINGQLVESKTTQWRNVVNPATQEVLARVPFATPDEVNAAVANAKEAFKTWRKTPIGTRARIFLKLQQLIRENMKELAALLTAEQGKTLPDAEGDVFRGLEVVEHAAAIGNLQLGELANNVASGVDTYTVMQPLGVCAGITPFNFPAMIPLWMFPMAIATGNTFVLKPSEQDPMVTMRLCELALEAGIPPGVLNVVHGGEDVVNAICDHPDIKAISFVGSTKVGTHVYNRASLAGKRVQCMMFAKNHAIVLPDANKEQSINAIVGASFGAAGQRCMAISVVLLVGEAQKWIPDFVAKAKALKISAGSTPGTDVGPVISCAARERVEGLIERGIADGAVIELDGRKPNVPGFEKGNFVGPTIFSGVKPGMSVYDQEIFGPVLCIAGADDLEQAIEFRIRAPKELAKYIAHKGSITVDGTSLTVNAVNGAEFELTIIPHTLSETIMALYQPGRRVNLEVDLLARYLERLLLGEKAAEPAAGNITESFLAANGYLKS